MACKEVACVPDDDSYHREWKNSKSVGHDEFVLTKIVGLTNISKNALDCNQVTGHVAFPASSMLVLLDPKTNDQKFIKSPSGRIVSCVSFSDDGRIVAVGEAGVKPSVIVYSLKDLRAQSRFTVDHSVGVKAIAIHPKLSYVVIIGMQDLNIGVWDYMRCQRLALTKWQTIPMSMTIPKTGSSVILCGHRKITLFNLDKISSNSYETNVFEDKKAVLLGRQSEYTFVDITSGKGRYDKSVYTVTTCGYLCEIRLGDILIDKASKVDSHAYCVRFALNHIFTGCCEGVVKICSPDTLNVSVTVSLDQLLGAQSFPQAASKLYLETTALVVNEKDSIVTCIYANCSIYSWRISNLTENIECSIILPSDANNKYKSDLDNNIAESVYRESMFRSLMGCLDFNKYSRLFDSETLAARNGMRCHHDLIHLIKGGSSKNHHVTTVRFGPDGQDVICGNEAGEIKVYDAATGVLRRVIEAHSAQVMCIELLYDDEYQLVCTGGRDRIIFILNAKADFSLVQVLCDHSAAITAISLISHDGLLTLVSAAADNLILVRRATPGNSLKFTVTGQIVESRCNKALNVSGEYIITGDKNGNIKLFKADPIFNPKLSKTLKSLPKGNQMSSAAKPMCIDPTGTFIATAQNSGQIVIYHLHTGTAIASLASQTDASAIKFTRCLRYIISSTPNGCTMIWRIPEKMTEFLVAKQNKSYEVAKEVSYETTIVSCVKICKEMTVRESPHGTRRHEYGGPDSNHNYDTDATPSIESLNFLRSAHSADADSDRNSVCSTESYLSCSTCGDSCSDTVHWCMSTDSSAMTNSATDRFCFANGDNMCGKIIEDSECRKLGPFRKRSDHVLDSSLDTKDEPAMSFNSNSKTYETNTDNEIVQGEHKQAARCIDDNTEVRVREKGAKKELRDVQKKMENETISDKTKNPSRDLIGENHPTEERDDKNIALIATEMKSMNIRRVETAALFTDSGISSDRQDNKMSSLTTAYNSATISCPPHDQKPRQLHNMDPDVPITKEYRNHVRGMHSDRGPILNRVHLGITPTSPSGMKRLGTGTSPISLGSYKTACSPQLTTSMDTSCSPGNSIFYSPSPCFSSEGEELVHMIRSPGLRQEAEYNEFEKRSETVHMRRHCDEMSSTITFVSNLSAVQSSRISDPCDINKTSLPACFLTSVSTSERRLDNIFMQAVSQTFQPDNNLKQPEDVDDIKQKTLTKLGASPSLPTTGLFHDSSLLNDDLEFSDMITGGVSCVEMSAGSSQIITTIESCLKDHVTDTKPVVQSKPIVAQDETREKSISELMDEEEVYNYHSITRDESGKLRLVAASKNSLATSPLSENITIKTTTKNGAENASTNRKPEARNVSNDSTLRNIQCSRCSHKEESTCVLQVNENAVICQEGQPENRHSAQMSHSLKTPTATEQESRSCSKEDLHEQAAGEEAAREDYMKNINDDKLEEYFSELRQCLQLTNSQETVYKLVCDAQDQELMDLLELVLKKRPAPLMSTLSIPPNQMEMYTGDSRQSADDKQQGLREMARDHAGCKPQTLVKVTSLAADRGLHEKLDSTAATKTSDVPEDKCEIAERETLNMFPSNQGEELDGISQITAKALIGLVGRILTSRRAVQDHQARAENVSFVRGMNEASRTAAIAENRSTSGKIPKSFMTSQQRTEINGQMLSRHCESLNQSLNQSMQQCTVNEARHDRRQEATRCQLDVLKLKVDEQCDDSDSLSDISLYKTRSNLSTSRTGKFSSNRTLDSGIESSLNEKLSSTAFQRANSSDGNQMGEDQCQSNWASSSFSEKTSMTSLTMDKTSRAYTHVKDNPCPETTTVPEDTRELRYSQKKPSVGEYKYATPIVELFRDQDDYLKKLKEVREKFEMSIQALSKERKSRLAEEEKQQNK